MIERAEWKDAERGFSSHEGGGHRGDRAIAAAGDHGVDSAYRHDRLRFRSELVAGDATDVGIDADSGEGVGDLAFRGSGGTGGGSRVAVEEGDDVHAGGDSRAIVRSE